MNKSDFFSKFYNFALVSGKKGGLSPLVILTQAYLESGAGESSLSKKYNNFFGIKADSSWGGKKVLLTTREVKNGVEYFPKQYFRVYSSPSDSFNDHVAFLKRNPRYTKAGVFTYPDNPLKQIDSIARSGYATDPNYGKLLADVLNNFITVSNTQINPNNALVSILIPAFILFGLFLFK